MLYRYTDNSLQLPFGYKASKDWAAILDFDNDGILCSVGYNEASVLVPLFDRLSAATRSANDGYLGIVFELRAPPRDGHTYEGPICVIQRVANGSPADRAGLRPGDVVSAINSMHVGDNLPDVMHHVRPGDVVTFTVHPTGKITPSDSRDVRVTIGRRPSAITRP
jgi:S1-C subfamily serine protease